MNCRRFNTEAKKEEEQDKTVELNKNEVEVW